MSRPQSSSFRDFKPIAESSSLFNVEPNDLLLVTLSTVVMLAKNQKVPKEYYHCSKFYLKSIKAENPEEKLPNAEIVLKMLDEEMKEEK